MDAGLGSQGTKRQIEVFFGERASSVKFSNLDVGVDNSIAEGNGVEVTETIHCSVRVAPA